MSIENQVDRSKRFVHANGLSNWIARGRFLIIVCVLVLASGVLGEGYSGRVANGQGQALPASVSHAWDSVFETKSGWTGGDGAGTVALGDGRVVWMFGDSFIGGVAEGKHAPGSHMINNVFAVQKVGDRAAPRQAEFEFAWGPNGEDGKPTAWIVPDPQKMGRARKIAKNMRPHGWFWPAGGGVAVDVNGKRKLYLFLFQVGSNGKEGVWGFENIGGAIAVVENPQDPISQWRIRQVDLPMAKDGLAKSVEQPEQRLEEQSGSVAPRLETNWGLSCFVLESRSDDPDSGFVYVYGDQNRKGKERKLILARVRPSDIEDFSKWRFFSGQGGWVVDSNQVEPIAIEMAAEVSIEKIEFQGKTKFVMVHSHWMLGTEIFIRTADAPEGPWSKPRVVFNVTDTEKSKNYFTYAAKGHLAVSPANQLLITYVVNSFDFWEMAGDASIYRPRCITVPLAFVFE